MGRGGPITGLAALVIVLGALSTSVQAGGSKVLVDDEALQVDRETLVYAVVDTPAGDGLVTADVTLQIETPDGVEEVTRTRDVQQGGPALVSLTWTPSEPGPHVIRGQADVGPLGFELAHEPVEVAPAEASTSSGSLPLPGVAPESIQWAIVFGALYMVAHFVFREE